MEDRPTRRPPAYALSTKSSYAGVGLRHYQGGAAIVKGLGASDSVHYSPVLRGGIGSPGQRGTIPGAGGIGSLIRKSLGGVSAFRKVRLELLRPSSALLDPILGLRFIRNKSPEHIGACMGDI